MYADRRIPGTRKGKITQPAQLVLRGRRGRFCTTAGTILTVPTDPHCAAHSTTMLSPTPGDHGGEIANLGHQISWSCRAGSVRMPDHQRDSTIATTRGARLS